MQALSAGLDPRRRRVLFRSWHRGMRETDLLLGQFADAHIAALSEEELDQFEALLEALDRDVFSWLTGEVATPSAYDTALFRKILAFHTHSEPIHA
jgi:antitoxin CptB